MIKLLRTRMTAAALAVANSSLIQAYGATFGDDLALLKKYTDVVVLSHDGGQAKVAVVPAWQGRVMTSTAEGDGGASFGWINRELIASGKLQPQINVFGGEDRFWLGPEGGQFSIFFAKGAKFDLEHWFTSAAIDKMAYKLTSQSKSHASFAAEFSLVNYSEAVFDVRVDREVRLLSRSDACRALKAETAAADSLQIVAFETHNKITNAGMEPWKKETGLLSIWILGMFNPSPTTTIVVPINKGSESELGARVTSDYFGEVPSTRLVVKDRVAYFSGDGRYRSKIGVNPKRSRAVFGSYDAANQALTIVHFTKPKGVTDYVNSLWKLQDEPYAGDAANSYNDGPAAPGAKPLGPFYELESSSPAAALAPGESLTHMHRTIHLTGSELKLGAIARVAFGVSLDEIKSALPR